VAGKNLELRPKEYSLLEDLARRPGEVVSRSVLAERVWGQAFYVTDNVIDVTVSGLRQRLAQAQQGTERPNSISIATVRGVGYRLDA
jgi:DNA-binding response OmpR family regulator